MNVPSSPYFVMHPPSMDDSLNKTNVSNHPIQNKIEYDMFQAFIRFLVKKDNDLISLLKNENSFNPATLFNYITNYNKLTVEEFAQQLLTLFKLSISKEELLPILGRYSLKDYYFSYAQFVKLFGITCTEIDLKLAVDKYESVSTQLKDIILTCIKTAIQNEVDIEVFRKKLNKMTHFNLKDLFNAISDGNVYITTFDLEEYFNVTKEDSNLLIRRFDKDDDGKISYDDVS